VKSYNDEKGWGHIQCQETEATFGKDMFFLRSSLNGASVTRGSQVLFTVAMGTKGPQAENVQVQAGRRRSSSEDAGQTYQGTIKNFNEAKGWGFITCAETEEIYHKDIFVHKKEVGCSPVAGDAVTFEVNMSSQGRPEAQNVFIDAQRSEPSTTTSSNYGAVKEVHATPRPGPF